MASSASRASNPLIWSATVDAPPAPRLALLNEPALADYVCGEDAVGAPFGDAARVSKVCRARNCMTVPSVVAQFRTTLLEN